MKFDSGNKAFWRTKKHNKPEEVCVQRVKFLNSLCTEEKYDARLGFNSSQFDVKDRNLDTYFLLRKVHVKFHRCTLVQGVESSETEIAQG